MDWVGPDWVELEMDRAWIGSEIGLEMGRAGKDTVA